MDNNSDIVKISSMSSITHLDCKDQNYAWGKLGKSSMVSKFVKKKVDDKKTYAELWMGTHPKGESNVIIYKNNKISLRKVIKSLSKEKLGAYIHENGMELPFLFKILSVNQPLSIQLHPNKKVARELFEKEKNLNENEKHYRDPNHKPELTIAITPFEALCGFRELKIVQNFINSVPEFLGLIAGGEGKIAINSEKDLKEIFRKFVVELSQEDCENALKISVKNLREKKKKSELEQLFLRIYEKYPKDRCCYCVYFFQYHNLKPGESLFIEANIPHCYISGDCVEIMSNSDNVIRCGLTPKFIDSKTLMDIVDVKNKDMRLTPKVLSKNVLEYGKKLYREFKVVSVNLNESQTEEISIKDLSIAIVIYGKGKINNLNVVAGEVYLIHGNQKIKVFSEKDKFLMYIGSNN